MLKEFRRRFILLNMMLVGVSLMIALIYMGTVMYHHEYKELQNTMSNVLRPLNGHREPERQKPEDESEETSKEKKNKPDSEYKDPSDEQLRPRQKDIPAPISDTQKKREYNDNISTVYYYSGDNRISVISDTDIYDGDMDDLVHDIISCEDHFGTLDEHGIIYYYEKANDVAKIAICSTSYINSRMFRIYILMAVTFIIAMLLLLPLSMKLAHFAEEPLKKAVSMERTFVGDLSHDMKTPITIIMANNSIIRSNPDSTINDNMQWIDSTDRAAEDMMQMISNMMTLTSVDVPKKNMETVPVSLTSAAQRCMLQFESLAYEKGIELEYDIKEELTVRATDDYIKRICSSLVENALKYEPSGGKIIVKAYSKKHKAFFVVQNLNSIISEDDFPHIFDRFYRGDKTRSLTPGHGLGLPIIKQMSVLCGGDISASSSSKDGTVFTVTFICA